MDISLAKNLASSDLTVIPLFSEDRLNKKLQLYFDSKILSLIETDFTRKPGEIHLTYGSLGRIMLLGLGNKKSLKLPQFRKYIQSVISACKNLRIESMQIIAPDLPSDPVFFEMLAFALVFGSYNFTYYKRQDKEKTQLKQVVIVSKQNSNSLRLALSRGQVIAEATNKARDLANHPANIATPKHLAAHALAIAKENKIKIKILDEQAIKKEGLGLLMGVSSGSEEPPRLIVMDWGPTSQKPLVLVGKGLTFDSGGVSIKPADRMDEMKFDMCGGATVLGIMEAAAKLKLKQRIIGIIPSSENLLSGRAVKPGDVLRSHNGLTVEVINTDAEGRMILADAISYAKKYYQPKAIIDYATLTGAVIIALGDEYTGYISNTKQFDSSMFYGAAVTGEKIAHLPLAEEYKNQLTSIIADTKNTGEKGNGGAITAALFLQKFVGDIPWAHLDMAGTAWTTKSRPHMPPGATGWGVYFTLAMLSKLR